ncbi:MAG TPA: carbohydrate ABC transporter permease [Chloroflexota bacterium]|nr:carbohydrate ABC transporter permease [Chloroflexota bacterium]
MTAPARMMSTGTLPTAAARGRARGRFLEGIGFYAFVIGFVVFCMAPFIWTLLTSFKGPTTIYETPIRYLPIPFDLVNYRLIFELDRFRWALVNSVIVASSATAISLVIGSICAYAIARLDFPCKNLLLALVLAIAMFPGIAIIGPLFKQFNAWGLTNNYLALILPNVTFTLPICIWTLTAFFSDLPIELEESARVDGCTRMQAFYKIVVPLAAPGVFTAAILLFIHAWNEFLFARTFMSQPNRLTATVAIAQFEGADIAAQYPWGQITAASIVITLPLVLLVLIFQRRIVSGLTAGAVKG